MAEPLVKGGHNVSFAGVARGDRVVAAWCSYGASVDLSGVRKVLSVDQMPRVEEGKHYNFSSGAQTWHLMGDDRELIFVVITAYSYPLRHASALLQELRGAVSTKTFERLAESPRLAEGSLNPELRPTLMRLCERFDDLKTVDQLHATLGKVESVKVVMQESIELALANCVALESIDQKADELQSQAGMFKTRAKKLRTQMWWKKCKMQLLLTAVIIAVLAVIIIPTAIYFNQANKKKK
ncbi:hypothetical protein CTAYLR_008967 [Chrysophaeum taylorii]|uniref:V-SNARE coiled-coil homology domain-containing protein n=1 Tax=Chrysophaeum taylorii TaxID=2483200 RepID=A0AAD7XPQ6_9STRA|nr:hypothetical protein CTAYLR_008967 [Chrysophaeum taylorii]